MKQALLTLFQSGKSSVLPLIQLNLIRNSNIKLSDIPANITANLPKSLINEFYKNQNVTIANINTENVVEITSVINGININDILNLKSQDRLDIILKMLQNANSMDSIVV